MGRNQGGAGKKKEKIKCVTHVPSTIFQQGGSSHHLSMPTMVRVKKLKTTESGFRVTDTRYHSDVNAAIAVFAWKETQLSDTQLDALWNQVHQSAGWDPGYVDSFVEMDQLPPESDPELPKTGQKGVSAQPMSLF
jgi:hypothetical protein